MIRLLRRTAEGMMKLQPTNRFSVPLWLLALAAAGFVLGGLGSFPILDNNEGLYAEIPREMLASHDWRMWVIPHLNGLPYMEKPPLLYWLTALSFALFGEAEWAARLVPALSSLACVFMLQRFGTALGRPQAGRLAALIFVSGIGVTAMSHVLMFDMLLTALLTAALMFACLYLRDGQRGRLRAAYAFLALAVLAKGFVALILFGLVAFAVSIAGVVAGRSPGMLPRALGRWFEPWSLLVFFAIAAPWHVAASLTEPIFAWFYFINEHVLRFLGKREPHDYYSGSWWYYLPRMAIYLFPWSFLLPALPFTRRAEQQDASLRRFLLLAWLMPLLFFSISSAKANYYLVAVMPFAAFHLATALEDRGFLRPAGRALPVLAIGLLAIGLGVALVLRAAPEQALQIMGLPQQQFAALAALVTGVLALGAAWCAWCRARIGILAYVVLPAWIVLVLTVALQAMAPTVSTRPAAYFIERELPAYTVYLYRHFEQQSSLPFYLKRPLPVIDPHSADLFWGDRLREGNGIMLSIQGFKALAPAKTVIVVPRKQLGDFSASGLAAGFPRHKTIGDTTVFFN